MSDDAFTIDELARRVGMTVRNVRAHQSRGLLPAPEIRGRTGWYGLEHVARLETVKDLQARGFNLEAIRQLIEREQDPGSLDFARELTEAFRAEEPELVSLGELRRRWGKELTPEVIERVAQLGLGRLRSDGLVELPSARLVAAAEELAEAGVPLGAGLDVVEDLVEHARAVSDAYVDLFLSQVWEPFAAAGEPSDQWDDVRRALARLKPLAGESLLAVFSLVMDATVREALNAELSRLDQRPDEDAA